MKNKVLIGIHTFFSILTIFIGYFIRESAIGYLSTVCVIAIWAVNLHLDISKK